MYYNSLDAWIIFLQALFYFVVAGIVVWSFLYAVCREPAGLVYRTLHITVSASALVLGFGYFFLN